MRDLIDNDEEKLNQTRYTQPAILTTSLAIYRLLIQEGIHPDMVAGLSLGEYSALVASGALDFQSALALLLNAEPSWKKRLQQVLVKWWQFLMLI